MNRKLLAALAVFTIALTSLTGCRGGLCSACGGGAVGGYGYQQPNCGCGTGYQQQGMVAPPGTFVQPGGYVQPGYQQPGVVAPQQLIPQQAAPQQMQPGAQFGGSGTR